MSDQKAEYGIDVLTGIRPTGNLTIGNVIGAVFPLLDLQKQYGETFVFVADLHGLTDKEPSELDQEAVVADYIALGLDPSKLTIFKQSDIKELVSVLTVLLMRHMSVAELMRVPTLKEKLKEGQSEENANSLLANYPVMMAADILLPRAHFVPIGEDQLVHMEVTRKLAKRFNSKYGEVFPMPQTQEVKPLRILSLQGEGKMSKSKPESAVFLTDEVADVHKKIMKAATAIEGEMNDTLESHFILAENLASGDSSIASKLSDIRTAHMAGEKVMGDFKKVLSELVTNFLSEFQDNRASVTDDFVSDVLSDGAKVARAKGEETMALVYGAMGL